MLPIKKTIHQGFEQAFKHLFSLSIFLVLLVSPWTTPHSLSQGRAGQIGEKYAVVIGISDYKHRDIPDLRFAVKDATDFYNFLIEPKKGGFKPSNVKLLLDDHASLINIKKELGIFLARKAGRNDLVVIYFAGHGAPETDMSGAADDGIYELVGDDDDGTSIDTLIRTGLSRFGSAQKKGFTEAYVGCTSTGNLVLKAICGDGETRTEAWYELTPVTYQDGYVRTKIGRGLRGVYWQFELINRSGSDFDLDTLTLRPLDLSRRL